MSLDESWKVGQGEDPILPPVTRVGVVLLHCLPPDHISARRQGGPLMGEECQGSAVVYADTSVHLVDAIQLLATPSLGELHVHLKCVTLLVTLLGS